MGYRIDIACGSEVQPGCIGIDIESRGAAIQRDVRRGLPFSDSTVSEIYLNNAIEHFNGEEVQFLTAEMYRVLHNGGKIFLRVPHSDTKEAHHPAHKSTWNEWSLLSFESAGAPPPYSWNFAVASQSRSGVEMQATLVCIKKTQAVAPEAGKIAIITAVYNQLHHTKAFIQSIRRHTTNPYQIVVVDNASNDGTAEWLTTQSDITFVTQLENRGWVGGINRGIEIIKNWPTEEQPDFVIFANNDTLVDGIGWERRLLNHFDDTTGAVGPVSNYVAGRQHRVFNHEGILEEETNALIGFFMCVRWDVCQMVGALDDLYSYKSNGSRLSGGDDYDYSIRIREKGYRLLIARDVYIYHAGSQSIKEELNLGEYHKLCKDASKALKKKWGKDEVSLLYQSPVRVLCCVPMRNDYAHRTFTFTFATMRKPFCFEVADIPRAHIESARNAAVKRAKELEVDYLLFLDDDHRIQPDTFLRLFNMQVPVASALAFQRVPPFLPCIYRWVMDPKTGQLGGVPMDGLIHKGQRKVDCTGFAAVLLKMEALEKLEEPWFEWKSKHFGEDFDFSLKCKDAGIPIYCDTDLILPHIGDNLEVTEETYYAFHPEAAKAAGVTK